MSRARGLFELAGNYEPRVAGPLDARQVVDTIQNLTDTAIWEQGGPAFLFKGLLVSVVNDTAENNGVYELVDTDYTQMSSWVKIAKNSDVATIKEALESHIDDRFEHTHTFNIPLMQLAKTYTEAKLWEMLGADNLADLKSKINTYGSVTVKFGIVYSTNVFAYKLECQYIEIPQDGKNIKIVLYGPDWADEDNLVRYDISIQFNGDDSKILLHKTPFSGGSGQMGPTGPTGPQGPAGAVGPTGPKGDTGAAGADGKDGAIGPTGPQGEPGQNGTDGAVGPTGPQGEPGAAGEQGPAGAAGPTGPQGEAGEMGPTGPQGEPGPAGQDGAPGATGPTGPIGPTGPQGERGEQGIQGIQGPAGEAGQDGAQGPVGPTGPTGATGAVGPTGPKGEKGNDGTGVNILGDYNNLEELQQAHPTGNPGDAYLIQGDLYVWSATTTEWKNVGTIQGPQGERGEQGPQGLKGDTGETGAMGPTGPVGPSTQFVEEASWQASDDTGIGQYVHNVSNSHGKGNFPHVAFLEGSAVPYKEAQATVVYTAENGMGIKIYSNTNAAGKIVVRP